MANEFFTILTATGRNKLAAATATGAPLTLTQMAVGDGDNGAYYSPAEAQTALKHEVWRGAINHLAVDANNPNWIVAELVIPDNVGGFYIREVGLFDSAGAMIAVGKFPESYKPTLAAGSNKQLYVRMILEVTNTTAVTLLVDPSVVLATRQYCDDKVAAEINKLDGKQSVRVATTAAIALSGLLTIDGVVLAAGDRVLVKNQAAAADNGIYLVAAGNWMRAADADAAIEVTPGMFVSVEQGAANADSVWQLVTDAPITLGVTGLVFEMVDGKTGVVAGTYRSVTVNQRGQVTGGTNPTTLAGYGINDAASQSGVQQNTYSVASAAGAADAITAAFVPAITALTHGMTLYVRAASANATTTPTFTPNNGTVAAKQIVKGNGAALVPGDIAGSGHWIELQYDQTLDRWVLLNPATGISSLPAGSVIHVAQSTAPSGYLKANGAAVSRTTYAALFAAIGTAFGAGDGSTTFNLPDLRGEFLRALDDGRGVDSGRTIGSAQASTRTLQKVVAWDQTDTSGTVTLGLCYERADSEGLTTSADPAYAKTATGSAWTGGINDNATTGTLNGIGDTGYAGRWISYRPRNIALLACIKF
jgi:phage-related tail fiber protein